MPAGVGQFKQRIAQLGIVSQPSSQSISQVLIGCIAGIFAPLLADLLEPFTKLLTANLQQRPQDQQSAQIDARRHSSQAKWPRAANQAVQNCLRLVIGMMSQDHALQLMFCNLSAKQSKACRSIARRRIGRQLPDGCFNFIAPGDGAGEMELCRKFGDERGILSAFAAADLVIEVNNVKRQILPVGQQLKQSHAVCSSAHADAPAAAGHQSNHFGHTLQ